jgi:hypothetical protein
LPATSLLPAAPPHLYAQGVICPHHLLRVHRVRLSKGNKIYLQQNQHQDYAILPPPCPILPRPAQLILGAGYLFTLITLAFMCAGFVPASATLRLANQDGAGCGRVEVLHDGRWGTVCGRNWNHVDGIVACRQLGQSFSSHSTYGLVDGAVWLDDLGCSGMEPSLESCLHTGWGLADCGHGEVAGLCCSGESQSMTVVMVNARERTRWYEKEGRGGSEKSRFSVLVSFLSFLNPVLPSSPHSFRPRTSSRPPGLSSIPTLLSPSTFPPTLLLSLSPSPAFRAPRERDRLGGGGLRQTHRHTDTDTQKGKRTDR